MLMFAPGADINVFGANPVSLMVTFTTGKTSWPFRLKKVLVAGLLRAKAIFKFNLTFREILNDLEICHDSPP